MMKTNENSRPNYSLIFLDILEMMFPDRCPKEIGIFAGKELSTEEVLLYNKKLFGQNNSSSKYRSYDKTTIISILSKQKKHHYTNEEVSKIYNVSRNSLAKWKKLFLV